MFAVSTNGHVSRDCSIICLPCLLSSYLHYMCAIPFSQTSISHFQQLGNSIFLMYNSVSVLFVCLLAFHLFFFCNRDSQQERIGHCVLGENSGLVCASCSSIIWDQNLVFMSFCFAFTMEQGSFVRIT